MMKQRVCSTLLVILFLSAYATSLDLGGVSQEFFTELNLTLPEYTQLPSNLTVEINVYIVAGSEMDLFERTVYDSVKSGGALKFKPESKAVTSTGEEVSVDVRENIEYLPDNLETLKYLGDKTGLFLLIGDEGHNNLTREFSERGYLLNKTESLAGQLVTASGRTKEGNGVMVLYHKRVVNNLERRAVDYSPLSGLIPREYIPATAASIGIILMSLLNILRTMTEFAALDLGRKKSMVNSEGLKIFGLKAREAISLLAASLVLGLALSWTFLGPDPGFLGFWAMNSGICLLAALSHEVSHRLFGRLFNVEMEYKFWWTGSGITLLTSYLGSAFGIQGFLMEEVKDKSIIGTWRYGLMKLAGPVMSTTIMVAFALINLHSPWVVYQMIYTTASLWAMAEILPVKPLDGHDIRKWSRIVWFIAFTIISTLFTLVNFIL